MGHHHNPHGATDQPARRAKPSAPRSDDRGSKPPPTVPDRSREVKVHYGRAEFATFGGGGVDRRRRGGIQSRARPSPPVPRASCVASRAANRRPASCRHLSGRSHQARLATRDTPDDPARSARASARGASGARAAASGICICICGEESPLFVSSVCSGRRTTRSLESVQARKILRRQLQRCRGGLGLCLSPALCSSPADSRSGRAPPARAVLRRSV